MEFVDKHAAAFKAIIALLLFVSFFMMFTDQINLDMGGIIVKGAWDDVLFDSDVNAIGSFIGYLALLVASLLVGWSALRSHKGKRSGLINIISLVLILGGLLLVALVGIMYREAGISYSCGGYEVCASLYRDGMDFNPAAGPIVAIVFSAISFICLIGIMYSHRSTKKSSKENK